MTAILPTTTAACLNSEQSAATPASATQSESDADALAVSMRGKIWPRSTHRRNRKLTILCTWKMITHHSNLLPGNSNKGTSQSHETHISTSLQNQPRTTTCNTTNHQSNNQHNHNSEKPNNNNNNSNNNNNNDNNKKTSEIHTNANIFTAIEQLIRQRIIPTTPTTMPIERKQTITFTKSTTIDKTRQSVRKSSCKRNPQRAEKRKEKE